MNTRPLLPRLCAALAALWLLAAAPLAQALTLQLDFDTFWQPGASEFFSTSTADGLLARATVEKAAADISAVLADTPLAALPYNKSGPFTWYLSVADPYGIESVARQISAPLSAEFYTIYVGAQTLPGNTLGQGGSVSWGGGCGGSITSINTAIGEFNLASAGRGPQMGALNFNDAAITNPVSGLLAGRLWFDDDSPWTLDWQSVVVPNTSDLYSVALHEILHTLGFGTSDVWEALVDRATGTWTGASASGTPIDTNEKNPYVHLENSTMSVDIYNGNPQEVAMDPDILDGTRKYLTETDVAVLRDLGYVVTIPEPATLWLLGLGLGVAVVARRRRATRP